MRKLSVLAIVALMATASCTKDRTCTCTYTSKAGVASDPDKKTLVGVTKSQAKAQCVTEKYEDGDKQDCKLD